MPSLAARSIQKRALVSLLALLMTSATVDSQDLDNAFFDGTVRDSSKAPVEHATVIARRKVTGAESSGTTDSRGRYRIRVTEPGAYDISVGARGFHEEIIPDLQLALGTTRTLNVTLLAEGSKEEVTISSSGPGLVDTTRTVVGDTFSEIELEALPLAGRDPLSLVLLLGGTQEAPLDTSTLADEGPGRFLRGTPEESGIFSLTGAPATSNNLTVDGLDNNDDRSARERISLNPESISEVQVITNQYAAEYGRASGGRINVRTRGGTSRIRSEAHLFFSDESLDANTYFRNARGLGRIPEQRRDMGASLSGPIRQAKHFFFSSFERLDIPDRVEVMAAVPSRSNPLFPLPLPNETIPGSGSVGLFVEEFSTPETRNLLNARFDLGFSQAHNVTLRFDVSRGRNTRGFPGGNRLPETALIQGRDSDSISLASNLILSGRLVNQGKLQFSRLFPRNGSSAGSIGVVIEEPIRMIVGKFSGTESSPASAREERRGQFQDSLSFGSGPQMIKMGVDLQLVRSLFEDQFATGGIYTFDTVESFLSNMPSRFRQRFKTESRLSNHVLGLFLQNEWRIEEGLTLSTGLRWDRESIIRDGDNLSPRVAIAWDPFAGSKAQGLSLFRPGVTLIRAGYGIFYNRALLRTIDDFQEGLASILVDSDSNSEVLRLVRFPEPILDEAILKRFGSKETGFLRRVSPDLEIPYTNQLGLGIERQITKGLSVTADYVYTRGAHLWRETNINAPRLPTGFRSFTDYLLSRDFDNRPGPDGRRPVSGASADVIRFDLGSNTSSTPGAIKTENGLRVLTLGLNVTGSSNISAALNAVRPLRPEKGLTQVEELESTGDSFYHGGIWAVRLNRGPVRMRASYTLSKLIDEGTTNTASPQDLDNRRLERALSLQDQRHRLTLSGSITLPWLGIDLAPIISSGSSRPFNIGSGFDRNLNDIENDRPVLIAPIARPEWRKPGTGEDESTRRALALAPIGTSGNLPRNYGRGPGTRSFDLRVSKERRFSERGSLRAAVDLFNVFNSTIFSFGSEFIDRGDKDFLLPRRTQRPRTIRLSLKLIH
ncbi:MAG TPA: TonB-dependent receptor [Blastocatellia bacterium]|nr:TonB-dependent receptor [Blastocatellia bacterium]